MADVLDKPVSVIAQRELTEGPMKDIANQARIRGASHAVMMFYAGDNTGEGQAIVSRYMANEHYRKAFTETIEQKIKADYSAIFSLGENHPLARSISISQRLVADAEKRLTIVVHAQSKTEDQLLANRAGFAVEQAYDLIPDYEYALIDRQTTTGFSYIHHEPNTPNSGGFLPIEVAASAGNLEDFCEIVEHPRFDASLIKPDLFDRISEGAKQRLREGIELLQRKHPQTAPESAPVSNREMLLQGLVMFNSAVDTHRIDEAPRAHAAPRLG
ncbi:hypothetical protein [Pseudomonas sichuanensis]|uniref:hypothetical protein n=1 Tax=Pseudomonas sichuanensis TaxID=2213015 RepID=UPI002ACB094A|nr:hypothetical protein [Pseudomonas sichuanensis]